MENLKIVQATPADIYKLQLISRDTFTEAFSNANTEADMKHYLDHSFSIAKLIEELNNNQSQFYFAMLDDRIIGYLKINVGQAQTDIKDEHALEIERIYVFKAFHGKKAAQLLYNQAIKLATEIKAKYIWLGVWEKNDRAISFYSKNGFVAFDKHPFQLGNDVQTDLMMKKML